MVSKNYENILRKNERALTEAANGRVKYKKVFLKTSQYSQGNTCVGISFQ